METEKTHMTKTLASNSRYDGRGLLDLREVKIEKGVIASAEGSARVTMGDTEVIAGVKMGMESPYPDTPDQGNLMVGAELLPLSSPRYEAGPPSEESIEVARIADRGIREAHAIDLKKLCIESGEKVWSVMVDVCTINAAGNVIDVAALAAIAAIQDAKFPKIEDGVIDYKQKTKESIPLEKAPVAITVLKIGDSFIVDPTKEEEQVLDARLTMIFTEDGNLSAMQKGGQDGLSAEDISKMVDIALEKSKELRKYLE